MGSGLDDDEEEWSGRPMCLLAQLLSWAHALPTHKIPRLHLDPHSRGVALCTVERKVSSPSSYPKQAKQWTEAQRAEEGLPAAGEETGRAPVLWMLYAL